MSINQYKEIWEKILSKYNFDSFIYDLGDNLRAYHLGEFLKKALERNGDKDLTIYDFGAGNWLYLKVIYNLIRKYAFKRQASIVGFDFSKLALEWGVRKYRQDKPQNLMVKTEEGDFIKTLPKMQDNTTDIIISLETMEHIENDRQYLINVRRILRKNGVFIISVPNNLHIFPSSDWFEYHGTNGNLTEKDLDVGHYRRYSFEMLKEMLENVGFFIIDVNCYGFLINDYLDKILKRMTDNFLKKMVFYLFNLFVMVEDKLFNLFKVKKSGGIFILCKKTDA